jgi:serine O-acetyltransferase
MKALLVGGCFKFVFWMRWCKYLSKKSALWRPLYYPARIILQHYMFKFGLQVSFYADIGPGLLMGHFGGIVVSGDGKIGKNCNLSHGVTIGVATRGGTRGVPVIGDNVYLGPNAVVSGPISVGSNAAVGANCVVTKDVPDNAVVAGVPGRIISNEGSQGVMLRTDWE